MVTAPTDKTLRLPDFFREFDVGISNRENPWEIRPKIDPHLLKTLKGVFGWYFKWLQSTKQGRITIQKWFQNFRPTKKKKVMVNFLTIFIFRMSKQSDFDTRKMKIVRNLTITFFFLIGEKFWNHFWIVIRTHLIDFNH